MTLASSSTEAIEVGEDATDTLRDRLLRLSLAVALCVPFNVYLPQVAFGMTTLGVVGALIFARRLPQPPIPIVISALVLLSYIFVHAASGHSLRRSFVNSNHLFQFLFLTYGFLTGFHNGAFEAARLPRFLPYLVIGHICSFALPAAGIGQWADAPLFYEHNALSYFTIFVLLRTWMERGDARVFLILVLYLAALAAMTDRMSAIALSVGIIGFSLVRPPPAPLAILALTIQFFPIYAAINASESDLLRMSDADFNTYIRMEFIRSAWSMLSDHLLTGVGFDTLNRPISYPYIMFHPLLNNLEELETVTNHHSIFDTMFRFGPIFGLIFLWPILRNLYVRSRDPAVQAGILFQAFGLSFNAWLENQIMLSLVCFVTAVLMVENAKVRHGRARAYTGRETRTGLWPPPFTGSNPAPGGPRRM